MKKEFLIICLFILLSESFSYANSNLFYPYVNFPVDCSGLEAVAIGDVNGDGRNDIVMTCYSDVENNYGIYVFLQNALGALDPPIKYPTNSSWTHRLSSIGIGDLNHDGRADVVVGNCGSNIEVFIQNASGGLEPGVSYPAVDSCSIKIADLNNDGLLDVVGSGSGNSVSVFLQNTNGTLSLPITYSIANLTYLEVDVGDVNNDGLTDIIVVGMESNLPNIGVLLQRLDGSFDPPVYYDSGGNQISQWGVAIGDVNGDNLQDIVVTYRLNRPNSKIGVLLQNSAGTMNPVISYPSYDIPEPVVIADVNGDGKKDIIVAHGGWSALGVYLQGTDGTLMPEELYSIPYASHYNPQGLAVGDINGDGFNDVVIADYNHSLVVLYNSTSISVASPNGGETFTAGSTQTIRWNYSGDPGSYVKIELFKGGVLDLTIEPFALKGTGGSGSFNWTIPTNQAPGTDYRIRVTSTTHGGCTDISDTDFTIAPPTITVVSPNGGEAWSAGGMQTIRWTYSGNPGSYVKIELLKGGVVSRTIASSISKGTGGSGSYDWTISSSQALGADYRIRVTSTSNGAYTDTSDRDFTIIPPTLTVVSPNGGEKWAAGSIQTISWSYTGSPKSYVKIELLKGGVLNRVITSSCLIGSGGSSSYTWVIPTSQAGGSDYQVRVTSTSNSACTDTSNGNFTITGPSITVTSPNRGETWAAGSTQTIQWTYAGNPGSYVKIELLKGGMLNRTIVSSVSKGTNESGSYNWVVPSTQTAGSDYQVRVTSTSNSACTGTNSGNFTITGPPPPSITVTSPNGGETWAAGTTQNISWSSTGNPGSYVKIELLKSGILTLVISSSCLIGSGGSGSYAWIIPTDQAAGNDYQVRVTSTANSAYTGLSDSNFTIAGSPPPTISVVSPNGGESWAVGTRQTIRWSYSGNVGSSVKIELLKAGVVYRMITSSALGRGGSGSYDFSIPYNQAVGSDYRIRVTSTSNNSYSDISDSNFTISK
jgi:hypothetical protein